MLHTDSAKALEFKEKIKFCPYKGEYDWLIECIGPRCMKYDLEKGTCTRT
jgi:hypothetical protein